MPRPRAYQHIAHELRERVLNGTYTPATRMPSRREVQEEIGVSQAVVRSAYQALIGEGLVDGRFGGGYYVRDYRPIIRHGTQRLVGGLRAAGQAIWDADPGTAGRELIVDDVRVSTEDPPGDVANDLSLETGSQTVTRRRRSR